VGFVPSLFGAFKNREKSSPSYSGGSSGSSGSTYTRGPAAKKTKKEKKTKKTKKTKKDTEKEEKFALAELTWLKGLRKDINDSKNICGTKKSEHGINLIREERTVRRMRSRTNALIADLNDFEKITTDKQKGKIVQWKKQITVYFASLVKVGSRGGALEQILSKPCTNKWNEKIKKKELINLLDVAIKYDTALIVTLEEMNREFNKALLDQQVRDKAEKIEEE
jgi:hypothetical protein